MLTDIFQFPAKNNITFKFYPTSNISIFYLKECYFQVTLKENNKII